MKPNQSFPPNRSSKPLISCESVEDSWAVLGIDLHMKGKILINPEGQKFLEGELHQPRWAQANACASLLARLLENVFFLDVNALQLRMRIVAQDDDRVQPEIHISGPGLVRPDIEKIRAVVASFGSRLAHQRDITDAQTTFKISQDEQQMIEENVGVFLQNNGGQAVQHALLVHVQDEIASSIRGYFPQGQNNEKRERKELTIEALYDGRKLRARTMFVVVASERTRSMAIFYDEIRFDKDLRNLEENKQAMLSLTIEEVQAGKDKACYELVRFDRISTPDRLELTASAQHTG